MRTYIIGNDGIALCRETPAAVNGGEMVISSKEELLAAPLNGKRLLALWNALPGVDKRRRVGDRAALIEQLWSAIERLPDPEPRGDPKRPSKQDVVIALLRQPEGATVDEVASVTGWQRHTVRGVFSGSLKKSSGSRWLQPKRNAVACTASPSRRAHDASNPGRDGSPVFWRAVACSRSRRQPHEPTGREARRRDRRSSCRSAQSPDARTAACMARIAPHRPAAGDQSRSADPRPRPSAAGACCWRGERGIAAPPSDPRRRICEEKPVLRSRARPESRRDIGATVARACPHCSRSR